MSAPVIAAAVSSSGVSSDQSSIPIITFNTFNTSSLPPAHNNNNPTHSRNNSDPNEQLLISSSAPSRIVSRRNSRNRSSSSDGDYSLFQRTMQSELEDADSYELYLQCSQQHNTFAEFSDTELIELSHILTVLRFHPGDVLIEIGERGSFACIILEGKFSVTRKGAKQSFVVSEGELLGEIALFAASKEAGVRSAQVVAETEGTVALITYDELEVLKLSAPHIRVKLLLLFANEGMKKLEAINARSAEEIKQIRPQLSPSTSQQQQGEHSAAAHHSLEVIPDDNSAAILPALPVIFPTSMSVPAVSLSRRPSIAQQLTSAISLSHMNGAVSDEGSTPAHTANAANGANAALLMPASLAAFQASAASSASSSRRGSMKKGEKIVLPIVGAAGAAAEPKVVEQLFRSRMATNERKKEYDLHEQVKKRKEAEHKAQNLLLVHAANNREIVVKNETIKNQADEIIRLQRSKQQLLNSQSQQIKNWKLKDEERIQLKQQLEDEMKLRCSVEDKLKALSKAIAGGVTDRTKKLEIDLEAAEQTVIIQRAKIVNLEVQNGEMEVALIEATATRDAIKAELSALRHDWDDSITVRTKSNADTLSNLESLSRMQSEQLEVIKLRCWELEKQNDNLIEWQKKSMNETYEKEFSSQRLRRVAAQRMERCAILEKDLSSYKIILQRTIINQYIKQYRRGRFLIQFTKDIVEWAKSLAYECMKDHRYAPRAESPINFLKQCKFRDELKRGKNSTTFSFTSSTNNANANGDANATPTAANTAANTAAASDSWSQTILNQEDCISLLNDLTPRMKKLVEEVCQQRSYWHTSCDAFFSRNIELKQEILEMGGIQHIKPFQQAKQIYNHDVPPNAPSAPAAVSAVSAVSAPHAHRLRTFIGSEASTAPVDSEKSLRSVDLARPTRSRSRDPPSTITKITTSVGDESWDLQDNENEQELHKRLSASQNNSPISFRRRASTAAAAASHARATMHHQQDTQLDVYKHRLRSLEQQNGFLNDRLGAVSDRLKQVVQCTPVIMQQAQNNRSAANIQTIQTNMEQMQPPPPPPPAIPIMIPVPIPVMMPIPQPTHFPFASVAPTTSADSSQSQLAYHPYHSPSLSALLSPSASVYADFEEKNSPFTSSSSSSAALSTDAHSNAVYQIKNPPHHNSTVNHHYNNSPLRFHTTFPPIKFQSDTTPPSSIHQTQLYQIKGKVPPPPQQHTLERREAHTHDVDQHQYHYSKAEQIHDLYDDNKSNPTNIESASGSESESDSDGYDHTHHLQPSSSNHLPINSTATIPVYEIKGRARPSQSNQIKFHSSNPAIHSHTLNPQQNSTSFPSISKMKHHT